MLFVIVGHPISVIIVMFLYLIVYIAFMPEKGFGIRFRRYHSTLDDFVDGEIADSVVRKRRKELNFSDIELFPGKSRAIRPSRVPGVLLRERVQERHVS